MDRKDMWAEVLRLEYEQDDWDYEQEQEELRRELEQEREDYEQTHRS